MDKSGFDQLFFERKPRIPKRTIFLAVLQIGFAVIWRLLPIQVLFWVLLPVICILGWAASFGWRTALREFRFWLDQITREEY